MYRLLLNISMGSREFIPTLKPVIFRSFFDGNCSPVCILGDLCFF